MTSIQEDRDKIKIVLASSQEQSICPICKQASGRIHSSYMRTLLDLPILGTRVYLEVGVRKFFCDTMNCVRTIFTERFKVFIEPYARKTDRVKEVLTAVAFASNAMVSHQLSKKLCLAVSATTFLRIIRRTPILVDEGTQFIGIDDWAIRKGQNYGTIICAHKTHRPIALFAERTAAALEEWLTAHPAILLATRDRSNSYAAALDKVCPNAIQVADRFHLSYNLLSALKEFGRRTLPGSLCLTDQAKTEAVAENQAEINLPKQEQQKLEGRAKKKEIIRNVKALRGSGMTLQRIAANLKLAKGTVSRYLCLDEETAASRRSTKCHSKGHDRYENDLHDLVSQGKRAVDILCILREKGLLAGKTTIFRWVAALKRQSGHLEKPHQPKSREQWVKRYDQISCLWTLNAALKPEQAQTLEKVFQQFPVAQSLYPLIQDFRQMIKKREYRNLTPWIERAVQSSIAEIVKFAKGLKEDFQEVYNALLYPYSNGLVEGHVNRLKTIKRMMFGRAKLDLLRQRVLYRWT
jgi:transposase